MNTDNACIVALDANSAPGIKQIEKYMRVMRVHVQMRCARNNSLIRMRVGLAFCVHVIYKFGGGNYKFM